jgi:hypothetical protein
VTANFTTTSLQSYLHRLADAFHHAQRHTDPDEQWLNAAGCLIRLCLAGPTLRPALWPALAHLETAPGASASAITFHLWDSAGSGVNPPRPSFTPEDYTRYGQRALADDGRLALMHAPTVPMLFAYDRATRQGYFWTTAAAELSMYERAAPLQTLFYWALAEFGWQIVHAAAVGTAQGGVLLIGSTGAGKSTTALSCLNQPGLRFLCDDKCMVRLEPEPQAFALFSSAKLKADMLARLPHFRPLLTWWDDYYKANKGLVFLHPTYTDHMVTGFPVKALLLPRVAHQPQAAIHPARPSDVFRQLGPSTVIWLPGAEAANYRFNAELTRRRPCYRLELAPEPERNAAMVTELLRRLN